MLYAGMGSNASMVTMLLPLMTCSNHSTASLATTSTSQLPACSCEVWMSRLLTLPGLLLVGANGTCTMWLLYASKRVR